MHNFQIQIRKQFQVVWFKIKPYLLKFVVITEALKLLVTFKSTIYKL